MNLSSSPTLVPFDPSSSRRRPRRPSGKHSKAGAETTARLMGVPTLAQRIDRTRQIVLLAGQLLHPHGYEGKLDAVLDPVVARAAFEMLGEAHGHLLAVAELPAAHLGRLAPSDDQRDAIEALHGRA